MPGTGHVDVRAYCDLETIGLRVQPADLACSLCDILRENCEFDSGVAGTDVQDGNDDNDGGVDAGEGDRSLPDSDEAHIQGDYRLTWPLVKISSL
ncbi:hypothetical protein PAAG_04360 [Paracoccidioides lutzii Pb01]|uniref:Uncharacterized protein n=1 Tax=Paracoccidioides lutzii (strain ATCC MYA-826 / Pb01) TaxID=502779 RepID=C1H0R6_PARBA|nr:hypothetical protein PAAG_04360 [Paracoccidioides lutzii Pb01]EEH33310.2 hypothetical protein PAAG_04360 [Paracoccidioides lutzii Pb01]